MKKILFLLLCTVSIYGQTSNGSEQEFDYGIKNNSTQTITTPPYLTTTGMDGTQGKIPSAYIEKTDNKQNSLAVDGTGTKYAAVDAVNKVISFTTPEQFGAIGNGITDDTSAIQACLNTTSKNIIFASGKTYLIDGGLNSSVADRTINFTGATIALKNSATTKWMLTVTGARTYILGGIWDGNKAGGNSSGSSYTSFNILVDANNCTISGITSINTFGMAIKGGGTISYTLFENNNISGTDHYGIFVDSNGTVNQIGNKAINNVIDISTNATRGQGILFTSILASGFYQKDWEISGNKIIGSNLATGEASICIAVRGHNGIYSNNTTIYGSMGISEGGDNTIYSNNIISDCPSGSISYGIEISGANCIVQGNIIKNVRYGIIGSNLINYDNCSFLGNKIETISNGTAISLQVQSGFTGKNVSIYNNNISALKGIGTTGDISGLVISGNLVNGQGIGAVNGRALFLDTPLASAQVSVIGNRLSNLERPFSVYSVEATSFSNLTAIGNSLTSTVGGSEDGWSKEGLATIGANVSNSWGQTNAGNRKHWIDQAANVYIFWSSNYNSPEGLLVAGVGSIFYSLNSSGGAYYKYTGTGNTGWRNSWDTVNNPTFTTGITTPAITVSSTPTTSTGTYDILTRNTSTGVVEKIASASGSYTPTLTNTTNVSSSTLNAAYYVRNGNIVTVTIAVQLTLTATTETVFTFSLPISGATVVSGIGQGNMTSGGAAVNGYGIVDITNSTTAQLRMGSTAVLGLGSGIANIMFTYSL